MTTYKIVRHYFEGSKKTIYRGLTLEQAQEHCNDKETSSKTCSSRQGLIRTKKLGEWFDAFTKE